MKTLISNILSTIFSKSNNGSVINDDKIQQYLEDINFKITPSAITEIRRMLEEDLTGHIRVTNGVNETITIKKHFPDQMFIRWLDLDTCIENNRRIKKERSDFNKQYPNWT